MIAEIQCLPTPSGTDEDRYAHVHAAIEEIGRSGLTYEVGPLGTSIEGAPDEVWPLLRRVHEATLAAGATSAIAVIKVAEFRRDDAPTMTSLTDRYRT
jgi:uncharacterized protein YqgV (UPF0045/DUF77 family)